jgi:hypothetical protein
MFRSTSSVLALLAAMTVPAVAADYDDWGDDGGADAPEFRSSYSVEPKDWTGLGDAEDSLSFEFGLRYWYSMGAQSQDTFAGTFEAEDNSHSAEVHLRVQDDYTNTFAKALAGYSFKTTGTFSDPTDAGAIIDGRVGYIGGDLGWNALGDSKLGAGPFVGYMYWNNSPRTERANFTTAESSSDIGYDSGTGQTFVPLNSVDNSLDVHMLRLGAQAKADFGIFDITAEAAAVPYGKVNGVIGNHSSGTVYDFSVYPGGNIAGIQASQTDVNGWGYGGMGEVMLGFHPTENFALRFGGRAWYLQGTADVTYDRAIIGNPTDSDPLSPPNFDTPPSFSKATYIETAQPFRMFRYGLLAEASYSF